MPKADTIKNVWKENLEEELANIRHLILKYNYVAMDTEFPGVVAKPMGSFKNQSSFAYQQLRFNVDMLSIIQLGVSLSDENGKRPEPFHTWQFNFQFNLDTDMYSQESIELLLQAKLSFKDHARRGINIAEFGSLLTTSGLVMSDHIVWVSFHSAYDFAYLIKILTGNLMPEKEEDFYKFMNILFPNFYDIKYILLYTEHVRKGLQEIANELGVFREGTAHQAGSDSLLTSMVFFKTFETLVKKETLNTSMCKLFGIEYITDCI